MVRSRELEHLLEKNQLGQPIVIMGDFPNSPTYGLSLRLPSQYTAFDKLMVNVKGM